MYRKYHSWALGNAGLIHDQYWPSCRIADAELRQLTIGKNAFAGWTLFRHSGFTYDLYTLYSKSNTITSLHSTCRQGVSISTVSSMNAQGVYPFPPPAVWTCRVYPFPQLAVWTQGVFHSNHQQCECAGCIAVHRLLCGRVECMLPFSSL